MKRRLAAGIDIGSHHIKMCVVEEVETKEGTVVRVVGTGISENIGMKHGYIVDRSDVTERIKEAKRQIEQALQTPINSCFLAIGGISLDEARATGEAIISRADQLVTDLDIDAVLESATQNANPLFLNKQVLHSIPLQYRLDGEVVLSDPRGMKGTTLSCDYLFITSLSSHYVSTVEAVEHAGMRVIDCMASPLASSYVSLSRDQKKKGCVLANIGAETASIVVYDEGTPVSVKVFPVGSSHITDDLALAFRISLEDAERIKLGRLAGAMYSKKKVDDVIAGRLKTMFEYIDKHLKHIGRKGALPAGIIFTGGGASTSMILDVAKTSLQLPAKLGEVSFGADMKVKDSTWAVSYGLALWGLTGDIDTKRGSAGSGFLRALGEFFKQFIP